MTGANSGIGLEATRGLVGLGGHLVVAVRDAGSRASGPRRAWRGPARRASSSSTWPTSIGSRAETLLDRHDDLAAVICNAGVMGGPLLLTPQRFERQMATHHLGHAALVGAPWPLLNASGARVVLVHVRIR